MRTYLDARAFWYSSKQSDGEGGSDSGFLPGCLNSSSSEPMATRSYGWRPKTYVG